MRLSSLVAVVCQSKVYQSDHPEKYLIRHGTKIHHHTQGGMLCRPEQLSDGEGMADMVFIKEGGDREKGSEG
jgi:hypothetical protein